MSENGMIIKPDKRGEDFGEFGCYINGDEKSTGLSLDKEKTAKDDGKRQKDFDEKVDFSAFYELAKLMDTTVNKIKDESCLFQVKNLMNKLGKLVARQDVTEKQAEKIYYNASTLNVSEIITTPIYMQTFLRVQKKSKEKALPINTVVDFPFGEMLKKTKISALKDCLKAGSDKVTAVISPTLFTSERYKEAKKQIKAVSRLKRADIAVSATELSGEHVKFILKTVEKTNVKRVLFLFGGVTESQLFEKMNAVNKYKGSKEVGVLASVMNTDGIKALSKLKVDYIATPYADDIGTDLIEKFNLKDVKLK